MSRQVKELQAILSVKTPDYEIRELDDQYYHHPYSNNIRFDLACALSNSTESNMLLAVDHFKYFIANNISTQYSFYNLALIYYSLGDYEKSLTYCEELYRQEPDDDDIKQLHLAATYQYEQKLSQDHKRDTLLL